MSDSSAAVRGGAISQTVCMPNASTVRKMAE